MRIGINGFGRIGRNFTKALLERYGDVEIVAVNDLTSAAECAHLFKYDSNYGQFGGEVSASADGITIDGKSIRVLAERDPGKLPWRDLGVDVVIESTGLFTDAAKARAHIDGGGAKKVIISAPAKGEDVTLVLGVNDAMYDPQKHHIISNASCTTNCLATAVKPIVDGAGLGQGLHVDDPLVHQRPEHPRRAAQGSAPRAQRRDQHHPDLDRRRQGALPDHPRGEGHLRRVRAARADPDGLHDLPGRAGQERDDARRGQRAAARRRPGRPREVRQYTEEELVSSDFKRNPNSSIVDGKLTNANGDLIQIAAWYDNEWGYSCRLADVTKMVLDKMPTAVA